MRSREFKEDDVLEHAMLCFWKKGFEGTSLSDLQKATGLGKASLYNAFKSKDELFQLSLGRYLNEVGRHYETCLSAPTQIPKQNIELLLRTVIARATQPNNPQGCLVVVSVQELAHHSTQSKKLIAAALDKRRLRLAEFFKLKFEKDSSSRSKPELAARYLCLAIDGLLTAARAGTHTTELEATIPNIMAGLE